MGRQFFRLSLAKSFHLCIKVITAFLCDEDKFPFSNAELNDKVKSLLMRAQNIFKNSTVIPSHPGAEPFFICFNAYKSSLSTTTPSHLSFCVAEMVGIVVSHKSSYSFFHPFFAYLLFIQIRRKKKVSLSIHNVYLLRKCPPLVVRHPFHYL